VGFCENKKTYREDGCSDQIDSIRCHGLQKQWEVEERTKQLAERLPPLEIFMTMARSVRFPPAMAMMRETTLSMFPEKNAFIQRTYLNLVKHKHTLFLLNS
jgi:hypothetical protein